MKLFGRELSMDETIGFVDSMRLEKNARCNETDCLVLQAAHDLATEVKHLREEVKRLKQVIRNVSEDY